MLVLPFIGFKEISIERISNKLIIETQAVVSKNARLRLAKLGKNCRDKLELPYPFLDCFLGNQTGNKARLDAGDIIRGDPAVADQRLTDRFEGCVRSDARELGDPVPPWIEPKGFQVVPVECHRLFRPIAWCMN